MYRLLATLLLTLLLSAPAIATELPKPEGAVLLSVSGKIRFTNQDDTAVFDLVMLESLQQKTTRTRTPWSEDIDSYTGPLGRALIQAVGAEQASMMKITALNDFSAEVPVSDFMNYDVIFALQKNERYLRIRDRGPLFTVYPFDAHPELQTAMHYNRSVWQVKAIEFY
ncbi:MAG: oxidoreductase [Marinospirillum sp.]|uniref:oxidoreductase n=1 Tax=Marinospirillum sp. TaxID=2183934 RepID=UPI0019DFC26B|nr:oxidoreductase [Marinospirillum sp.]MBE0507584.1 oxidoreductase [Marinospirillum sp.]